MSERKYHTEVEKPDRPQSGAITTTNDFKKKKKIWNIEELEEFFKTAKLPDAPIMLTDCQKIVNVERFLKSHIDTVKKHNGNNTYLQYYVRLLRFKEIIEGRS